MRGKGSVLAVVAVIGWSLLAAGKNPQLNVYVWNDAGASLQVVIDAEHRTTKVFGQAGVDVNIVNCGPIQSLSHSDCSRGDGAQGLVVRIVPRARTLGNGVFGVSFLDRGGAGTYADVFFEPIERLRAESRETSLAAVLGYVMAHELGHLLLGSNAHAPNGIMRAQWEHEDLRKIAEGRMQFTSQQAERMKSRVRSLIDESTSFGLEAANR
jgi:hypothetical protein